MESNHKLALIVAYYLSRFIRVAYSNLGFSTQKEAHIAIGNSLSMNQHTVKNMRDQFDPIHGHRVGWYQAPMSPSRVNVVEAFQDLDEQEIRSIEQDILNNDFEEQDTKEKLLSVAGEGNEKRANRVFVLRGPTGKKAEEYFIRYHSEERKPIDGELLDTRDGGCGYDFMIRSGSEDYFIEVKGLSDISGGVLFPAKEWSVAGEKGDRFILAVISGLDGEPSIQFIRNPAVVLKAKKNISQVIQVSWTVTSSSLMEAL